MVESAHKVVEARWAAFTAVKRTISRVYVGKAVVVAEVDSKVATHKVVTNLKDKTKDLKTTRQ